VAVATAATCAEGAEGDMLYCGAEICDGTAPDLHRVIDAVTPGQSAGLGKLVAAVAQLCLLGTLRHQGGCVCMMLTAG
jgi:hypothetical protein